MRRGSSKALDTETDEIRCCKVRGIYIIGLLLPQGISDAGGRALASGRN